MADSAKSVGALLVSLENVYGYGPTGGKPMTEDLPLDATTVKGRTRAVMTRELLAAAGSGRVRIAIGLMSLVASEVGHPVGIRSVPKMLVRALGLVNPLMRELAEMSYEFDEPFVLDTTKFESTFGTVGTPLGVAVADTIAWYRTRTSRP
jgi:hypothetical protein